MKQKTPLQQYEAATGIMVWAGLAQIKNTATFIADDIYKKLSTKDKQYLKSCSFNEGKDIINSALKKSLDD